MASAPGGIHTGLEVLRAAMADGMPAAVPWLLSMDPRCRRLLVDEDEGIRREAAQIREWSQEALADRRGRPVEMWWNLDRPTTRLVAAIHDRLRAR